MISSTWFRSPRPRAHREVVVIGGGIAGLATACLLGRAGHRVTLIEKNASLGGRAGSWESRGFRFDTGPSWYLMPECFDRFFGLLGTSAAEQLDLVDLDPAYRVFFESRPGAVDVRNGHAERLAEELEPGSGPRMRRYLDRAARLYRLAIDGVLYRNRITPGMLRLPQLRSLLPLLTRSLDAELRRWFRSPELRQLLGYPAVFLASEPRSAPALYGLMSHLDLEAGVKYPRGGFSAVVDSLARLARENGVTLLTSTPAEHILTEGSAVTGVRVAGGEIPADTVVSAVDRAHSDAALTPPGKGSGTRWSKVRTGPGAVLVLLGVRGQVPGLRHHTLSFSADWGANFDAIFGHHRRLPEPASMYVCAPSLSDDSVAPHGDTNLFLLVPVPALNGDAGDGARGGIDGGGDPLVEGIADRAIAALESLAGASFADRIAVRRTIGPGDFLDDFHSWRGNALGPAHTLGQSAFLRGPIESSRLRGLYYAGGTTAPGVGVPMCLIGAELAAARIGGLASAGQRS